MSCRAFCRWLSLLCFLLLVLAGPAGASQVKVMLWHSLDERTGAPEFEQICKDFNDTHPHIQLEVQYAGSYGKALEKMQVAWAGGVAPNIAMLEQTRNTIFYYFGGLLKLDDFINGLNGIDLNDFSQSMLGSVTYDGSIYGLPYNTSTPLIYYNKDLFMLSGLAPVAPKTWNEILEFSRKIAKDKDGDGRTDVFGIDFYAWGWLFEAWIGQNGARVLNDSLTAFTLNSPEAVEAMQFTQDLVHKYNVAYYAGESGYNLFWTNRLAMGERSTASLADNISKSQGLFDMGVAPLACNKECYAPIGGGNLVLFNTGSDAQKEAAWEVLKFITSTEQLARFSASTGYMAARRSSFNHPILRECFATEPRYRATYEQMEVAYSRPKVPFWNSTMAPELEKFYKLQFSQNGNVKQGLDEIARLGNIALAEWKTSLTDK